jgi:hypothetical protein
MVSWIALICAIPLLILGIHGLYAYFQPWDTIAAFATETYGKLFFSIDVPSWSVNAVSWMTARAFQSFFVPVVFLAGGVYLTWFAFNRGLHMSFPTWKLRQSIGRQPNSWNENRQRGYHPNLRSVAWWKITIIRVLLNLTIVIGFITLIWFGSRVFSHQTSPLVGSIILLLGTTFWIGLIWFMRTRYIWYKPSFKLTTLCMIVVVLVFAFAGVEPFQTYKDNVGENVSDWTSGKGALTTTTPTQKITLKAGSITWEVVLKSVRWSGSKVIATVSVTNKGKSPADFPFEKVDPLGIVIDFGVVDSYGMWFSTDGSPIFNASKIYPGETRTFKPSCTVSPRSGYVVLYVTWFTGTSRMQLFNLGAPK